MTMSSVLLLLLAAGPPLRHWAFVAPVRGEVPGVKVDSGPLRGPLAGNPIDAFHLARLRAKGLRPAPEADRLTLLRRLSYTLTGLPPSAEEARAFHEDRRPDAYERVVERLLASPGFGERWAQHWLDVARFAETNGYEADGERAQAWRYRDWVADAFNADLPYPDFVLRQVAGDLVGSPVASGFTRAGPIHQVSGNVDPAEVRRELLDGMVEGVGAAFLGVTLTCARCHDHKFDPVPQRDYYRIEAFFSRAKPSEANLAGPAEAAASTRAWAEYQGKLAPLRAAVALIELPYRERIGKEKLAKLERKYRDALAVPKEKRSAEQQRLAALATPLLRVTWDEVLAVLSAEDREKRADLRRRMTDLHARAPRPAAAAWTLAEEKGPLSARILKRGNFKNPGREVTPGFPTVLGRATSSPGGRVGLGKWLASRDNPLAARVIVNRIWQHHFGRGLVATPNDFGARGAPPSHPGLLDWLAVELMESGWSLKHVHRLIVTSHAYRMSSAEDAHARKIDPGNRLLWRAGRRRMDGEALRDAALAVSGRLVRWHGGPGVKAPLEPEVYDLIFTEDEPEGLWPADPDPRQHSRRSLYLFNKRNVRQPMLEAFDQPDTLSPCGVRPVSTFAPQALILLNGPFMAGQSREMAARVWREAGADPRRQVENAHWLALSRPAREAEVTLGVEFLKEQAVLLKGRLRGRRFVALPEVMPEGAGPAEVGALADYCLALLNRNGFVHVD
jgi:hypothetical protein